MVYLMKTGNRSKILGLTCLLILSKLLTSLSCFLLFDFLSLSSLTQVPLETTKHSPFSGIFGHFSPSFQVLAVIQLSTGIVYTVLQKPFGGLQQTLLKPGIITRVVVHSLVTIALLFLWICGLQLCGAFRTILVSSHYDFTIAGIVSSFVLFKPGPKLRGTFLFGIGWAILLLYDDVTPEAVASTTSTHLDEAQEQISFSKNSIGLILLMIWLFLKFGFAAISKSLITDFGGSGRLHALSTLVSGIILTVLLLIDILSNADLIPISTNLFHLLLITVFGFGLDYYVDRVCFRKMEASRNSRIGTTASQLSALLIGLAWTTNDVPTLASLFAFGIVYLGVVSLTSTEKASGGGTFVGYSSEGLPLFSFSNQFVESANQTWRQSIGRLLLFVKRVFEDPNTRRLYYLFVINLSFCALEFAIAYKGNSLSLFADGFRTLFSCSTVLIGINSIIICHSKPTKQYPFGFSRVEVLCGFASNAIIGCISVLITWHAIQRMFSYQVVDSTAALLVAVGGIFVSLLTHSCRSLRLDSRQFILKNGYAGKNSCKLFLTDAVGRFGILFSSLLIHVWPGISFLDSLAAVLITCFVIKNVLPVILETGQILLLAVPKGLERGIQQALLQILSMEGVKGYKNHRFWTHSPEVFTGSMHIQVTHDTNEQRIIRQVNGIFCSLGFSHFTIQLEKDDFLARKNSVEEYGTEKFDTSRIKTNSVCSNTYDESDHLSPSNMSPVEPQPPLTL